jgi:hypothetical protein
MLYRDNIEVENISGERMQISEKLPKFEDGAALLVVGGSQTADFYIAHRGEIERIKHVRIFNPKYSDREGFFERRGDNHTFGSGSVYEDKKEKVHADFLRECEQVIREIFNRHNDVIAVHLFAPGGKKDALRECLPVSKQSLLRQIVRGTYYKEHPFELLKRIQKRQDNETTKPVRKRVRKILKKAKQARRAFGGRAKK